MARAKELCPTCGNRGVDAWHVSRCAYQADLRQRLTERATERGVEAQPALDLWAHLRNIGDDGTLALERALTVIDLGWRPVVGAR